MSNDYSEQQSALSSRQTGLKVIVNIEMNSVPFSFLDDTLSLAEASYD
jgi:hypothetical protein